MKRLDKTIVLTAIVLVFSLLGFTTAHAQQTDGCSPQVIKFSAALQKIADGVSKTTSAQELDAFYEKSAKEAEQEIASDLDTPISDADRKLLVKSASNLALKLAMANLRFEGVPEQFIPEDMKKSVESEVISEVKKITGKSKTLGEFFNAFNN